VLTLPVFEKYHWFVLQFYVTLAFHPHAYGARLHLALTALDPLRLLIRARWARAYRLEWRSL